MVQRMTKVKIADNTGAKLIQCIGLIGGSARRYAEIGDIIIGAVKEAEPRKEVKRHDIVRAVIIRQKKPFRRDDSSYIKFDEIAAVIIDKNNQPRGNRIFGPVPRELKNKGFAKIVNLAEVVV